ncbi:hypothetical protein [Amycolatopsis anabasis]|uniref:hypothetical protein n=1 Tax=Amycolatopsis anabasis TaxID=1840409 RepID=UPI00131E28B4|nr:hypothetical protein [Amycolatopsis anabasis]
MFVGRSSLLTLLDELVRVPAGGEARPVLVLRGCGGCGRTALLEKAYETWRDRTPAVLVRPLALGEGAVRPVMVAMMLGLSQGAVAFPRFVLAQIAIRENFAGLSHDQARMRLRSALHGLRDRAALLDFLRYLARAAGVPAEPNRLAEGAVARLLRGRRMVRFTWRRAQEWFGHQDQGFRFDPERVLIQLGIQAGSRNPAVRRGVDDLLVTALLADLRSSPANALVLLDDGEVPAAMSVTRSLLRVRRALAAVPGNREQGLPDPLTLVTTGGGADTPDGVLAVPVPDLPAGEVLLLARNHVWPDELGAASIAAAVYRLTRGHPEATAFLLRKLNDEPHLVDDLDAALRSPGPEPGIPVERRLLHPFVRGLSEWKRIDEILLEALITLSAARNPLEAEALAALLPAPVGVDSVLFTSPALWSPPGASARPRLHPLARYLGIRALAVRADARTGWDAVFGCLRARAAAGDRAGRLHHERLLGRRDEVAAELAELLPALPGAEWLSLLDEIVATPDPRERDLERIRGAGQPGNRRGHIAVLLGVLPALADPCRTEWSVRKTLRAHAEHSLRRLADETGDPKPFILRAKRYDRDPDRFL